MFHVPFCWVSSGVAMWTAFERLSVLVRRGCGWDLSMVSHALHAPSMHSRGQRCSGRRRWEFETPLLGFLQDFDERDECTGIVPTHVPCQAKICQYATARMRLSVIPWHRVQMCFASLAGLKLSFVVDLHSYLPWFKLSTSGILSGFQSSMACFSSGSTP